MSWSWNSRRRGELQSCWTFMKLWHYGKLALLAAHTDCDCISGWIYRSVHGIQQESSLDNVANKLNEDLIVVLSLKSRSHPAAFYFIFSLQRSDYKQILILKPHIWLSLLLTLPVGGRKTRQRNQYLVGDVVTNLGELSNKANYRIYSFPISLLIGYRGYYSLKTVEKWILHL